jgi:uncharacterized protein
LPLWGRNLNDRRQSELSVGRKTEISNLLANLPRLGVGLAYQSRNYNNVLQQQSKFDFLEVTADDYLLATQEKLEELERLTEHFTVIPQSLNLSLGSAEGLSDDHLKRVSELVQALRPPWWSEQIGYTRAGGVHLGYPAPLPFTREAIDVVAKNMITLRRKIAAPLILENPDFDLELPGAEMKEGEWVNEVLGWGGCGMLLDVTSFYRHEVRRGADPFRTAQRLPMERIVQVNVGEPGTEAEDEVWKLLDQIVAAAPIRGIVIEQNEKFSAFENLLDHVARARDMGRQHGRWN